MGQPTSFWYDGSGNPVLVRDANGVDTRAVCNDAGERTAVLDPSRGNWSSRSRRTRRVRTCATRGIRAAGGSLWMSSSLLRLSPMVDFFFVEPEVSAGMGPQTVRFAGVRAPLITRLHLIFEDWFGDAIIECTPCFVVTEELSSRLPESQMTGYELDDVLTEKSVQFDELCPEVLLPKFYWLKVHGTAGQTDFGLSTDMRLVVSEEARLLLEQFGASHARITPFAVLGARTQS